MHKDRKAICHCNRSTQVRNNSMSANQSIFHQARKTFWVQAHRPEYDLVRETTMNFDPFLANLSRVLAHTVVLEHDLGFNAVMCGDPPAPSPSKDAREMMKAYVQYLPELLRTTSREILPTGQAQINAQQVLAPQQAALETELYRQYGPQMNQIGSEIAAQNAAAQAQSDLALMQGPGAELVAAQRTAQEAADPEYFAARNKTLQQLERLFGSLDDPNSGLSGSQRAEMERSLARSNAQRGLEVPTSTAAVENAMLFGQAGQADKERKQAAIAQSVGVGTNFLPAAKSNVDVGATVLGRPTQANTGENRLSGTTDTGVNNAFNMGNNMWNNMTQLRQTGNQINANRRDTFDRVTQGMQAVGSMMPSCTSCYIFKAAFNMDDVPWFLREVRDRTCTLRQGKGYTWMSKWLVPAMHRSKFVMNLVWRFMVGPLTIRAGYLTGLKGFERGRKYAGYQYFWLKIWDLIGRFTK